ncbi:hypothetical protein E7T06_06185 [Deinococcus sp. Arct2-2]|uniref:hypothetical protein n=1 Tax=Deinococcus sp. Arct2-2 TaxID=2568653 RepID=UPI0010A3AAC1|nr:hypothetical protein [Deinococcus sp. Arct2-2]THF70722.1 hypothetical protein E7T06_06185 [Deinococcus sp. Arct2-2]
MKRLLFPITACLCLLTACPSPPPEILKIPEGEAALHGEWRGMLTPSVSYLLRTQGAEELYALRLEGGDFWNSFYYRVPRTTSTLVAIDRQTGQVLKQIPWNNNYYGYEPLRFRAATPSVPARLLEAVYVNSQMLIIERDPLTLAETDRWALPSSPSAFRGFNAEGTLALLDNNTLIDTRTRQLMSIHPAITQLLTTLPKDAYTYWSSDKQWFAVEDLIWRGLYKVRRSIFTSNVTGQAIDGKAQHAFKCSVGNDNGISNDALTLPDGGAALAYDDGVIELRRADGMLKTAVDTGECQRVDLSLKGDTLTFTGKTLGTVRLSDGQITAQVDANAPDAARLPILGSIFKTESGVLKYQQADGVKWQLGAAPKTLWLKANATWISETEYHVTGEARVNEEPLTLTAKAKAYGIKLQPQTSPTIPPSVEWNGELRRADGSLYAKISGSHGVKGASQQFFMELEGKDQDFAYGGELKR